MGSWRQRYARGPGPVKGFVTVPRTITKQVSGVSPSLRLPAVLCSRPVLPRTGLRPSRLLGGGGGHQAQGTPGRNEYIPTVKPNSRTDRGNRSVRVLVDNSEDSRQPGPATDPATPSRKSKGAREFFCGVFFFLPAGLDAGNRSRTRSLAVVPLCLGGPGREPAGAGESVWLWGLEWAVIASR